MKESRGRAILYSDQDAYSKIQSGSEAAFGYVNGSLYWGPDHGTMSAVLLNSGWDYKELINVPQAWGWVRKNAAYAFGITDGLDIRFASDARYYENIKFSEYQEEAHNVVLNWWRDRQPTVNPGKRNWF